jgi:UDP:flavonoid glycosyltransferase YjiC (YdhE family)
MEAVGLPIEHRPPTSLYRYLHLGTSPKGFLPRSIRFPVSTRFVRPVFRDDYGDALPPLPDGEWAYVAFSTVYQIDQSRVRSLVAELAPAFEYVLASGSFEPPAANVIVAPYIPQSLAMAGCAVVVCHGGRNTVLTALSAGVPLVCVPIASDQFFISQRVSALGVGMSSSWSARDILSAAVTVSRDDNYQKNATRFSEVIDKMPSIGMAVSAIEGVSTRGSCAS